MGVVNRTGLGNVRRMEVIQLCAQREISQGDIKVTKVKTEEILADALPKPVAKDIMRSHNRGVGGEVRQDRPSIAPVSAYRKVARDDWVDDQEETQE